MAPALRLPTKEEALLNSRTEVGWRASRCIRSGGDALSMLPGTILEAIRIEAWIERVTQLGQIIRMSSYREWVTSPAPYGLATTYECLCGLLERGKDEESERALAAHRKAWGTEVVPKGGNNHSGANQHTKRDDVGVEGEDDLAAQGQPETGKYGTADHWRARLARDASPDTTRLPETERCRAAELLEQVDAGKMRPNKAAVEMGYRRKPTPLETVQKAWTKASGEDREAIAAWIIKQTF